MNITTKYANAILVDEEEWNGLMATLEIYSIPKLKKKIAEWMKTPHSELLDEGRVDF